MTEEIKRQLWEWAAAYHCAGFIQNDPVQFPHRYERKQDIEISGLLTAIMSFGNRKQILKKADELHRLMGVSPHQYVLSCRWKNDFPATDRSSFYRMLSYADFHSYFRRLHAAYSAFDSLEDALCTYAGNPMERLCAFLEVSAKSPQKKLNMFLRWMIRKGPEVDFVFGRDLIAGTYCAFRHACLPCGLCFGTHRDRNIFFEECPPDY